MTIKFCNMVLNKLKNNRLGIFTNQLLHVLTNILIWSVLCLFLLSRSRCVFFCWFMQQRSTGFGINFGTDIICVMGDTKGGK